ncbi:protein SUBSTANDARD STARCH GRAIN 4, chloroplastic isoform X1 [Typha latifolia]|uniref:protein SUBSTANDARD STARCH GRAIN 4, chloroplastic isoform X1 n=2 Tax=Typha latifolia TaxID=4733 RepID=UPI003C300FCE
MSAERATSSLFGYGHRVSSKGGNTSAFAHHFKGKPDVRASFDLLLSGHGHTLFQGAHSSVFSGKRYTLTSRNTDSRSGFKVSCTKEPFIKAKSMIRSFIPLWSEGIFLLRCSIVVAVISAAGMMIWYTQFKARSFIEARLLPSVCSILSEYFQRELDFGRVRSVSPLGITLQSCSIGPHQEEFSCGEVSVMKLRLRPFASLRRGKIVIDAVLSRPCLLVAQKEDFSWLGIPLSSENSLHKHHSTEEGIDHRTKSRRLAREASASHGARERRKTARKAAEMGYIVPEEYPVSFSTDHMKVAHSSSDSGKSGSFFFMDQQMHWKDHHCIDTRTNYGSKHADLEKSFGIKVQVPEIKFWSRLKPYFIRRRTKRNAPKKIISRNGTSSRQRNLKRSAVAALAYFKGLDSGKFGQSFPEQGKVSFTEGNTDSGSGGRSEIDRVISRTEFKSENNFDQSRSLDIIDLILVDGEEPANQIPTRICEHSSSAILDDHSKNSNLLNGSTVERQKPDKGHHNLGLGKDTVLGTSKHNSYSSSSKELSKHHIGDRYDNRVSCNDFQDPVVDSENIFEDSRGLEHQGFDLRKGEKSTQMPRSVLFWPFELKPGFIVLPIAISELMSDHLVGQIQKLKSYLSIRREDISDELAEGLNDSQPEGIEKTLPITLDSVYFTEGTLMLLGYGDQEPREMTKVNGHVKFQNHYTRVHVQLSGNCMEWREDHTSEGGGQLSAAVFVDTIEQKWHANLDVMNLFAPLFERILEIPVTWYKGRATGEVHICMSKGDTFPNLHGQLDVKGLSFQIIDAPSCFSELTASLCFRGQRVFLHNTSGWFGDAPLEASGDFGINPEDGEFHLMCQVPGVEINALMKTLRMRPLLFPLAGSVTAVFNCQGPLDAPIFVGSGIISRKSLSVSSMPPSRASEAVMRNKEAGAVAAFDRIPFSHVSANFTFNLDNCVADLYGIRATLLDGGEIRGAGNAWVCPEGEVDDSAMDINLSGSFLLDKVLHRYMPEGIQLIPLKIGELNGETRLFGSLLKPKFDIKWAAPNAEDSFADARGNIAISHDYLMVTSSSIAFDLITKVQTSYVDDYWLHKGIKRGTVPLLVEGVDLDLRMRGFEFASLFSTSPFESPRPLHLKATGRIKFQGRILKSKNDIEKFYGSLKNMLDQKMLDCDIPRLVGEISLSGLKLNQLMLAPQLAGVLSISHDSVKLNAFGRPDENLSMDVIGPLWFSTEETMQSRRMLSVFLQKGQLRANISYHPENSTNLEVRNLPLDELELASLRGIIQKAELQLNFQKRRGHGLLSVLHPKFSGVLGEGLDVAARWSGDVITIEKSVLEQASSRYELQGEYVLPGTRDRYPTNKLRDNLIKKAMGGHLGSVISSMGRWRMRLEVPGAEVAEMLPLARLLSRSTDPAVRSRSKELFIQSLQSVGFYAESLHDQLKAIQTHYNWSDDNILEDITLPGLAELKGHWHGSLDASGGGNGDTMADFDFHGEDWEWGTYRTQRVSASGVYSNNDGLRLEQLFIQKDNATLHADGTLLGPITNLHFAVLNFPVGLVPTLVQIIESSTSDSIHFLRQWLTPIKGILHMEGDLRGSLAKPECDVQIRLLDGAIGGIDLGRAEIVASVTSMSRFLFNANFEPVVQSGHVHIQGSVPVAYIDTDSAEEIDEDRDIPKGVIRIPVWIKENERGSFDDLSEKRITREKIEEGWDFHLAESLKGLNWDMLDPGEVRVNADIKDGGMTLITALCPYANWLHGYADIVLQVKGTVEQPVVDGSASFHRASVSSPVLRKPLTNFGGTVHVVSNRLCISSMESRVSRRGKLSLKGNLPLKSTESSIADKIELKCEVLEVRAKNILSGQVDSQVRVTGSILQPNISGMIQLSHGEAYLPHDKGNGAVANRLTSDKSSYPAAAYNRMATSKNVSRSFGSVSTSSESRQSEVENAMEQANKIMGIDVRLSNLKLMLGPELRIVYPLILNFVVSGDLELDGMAHPKCIRPKGILTFENGDVNLVATQVRLKRDHLNIAKFEPDLGLDPILDLVLVGSEWQFRIQSRASTWQDKLLVTSTRSVDQGVLSPTEAAKVFETQLAESLLEGDGQLAFKKLATATLETLMPRIEGKGEFGQARWRLVYAPQIPSLLSVDPTADPLKSLANNIFFATEVEVQLGKRLQASVVRQMKDSEMAMQWTLIYQLTSRLRVLFQSTPSNRLLFEYSATSQG